MKTLLTDRKNANWN